MVRTSLLEKLIVLKDLVFADAFIVIVLASFIIIGFMLLNIHRFNKDIAVKSCIAMYALMMFCIIFQYHTKFFGLMDYLINNIFFNIVFPNLIIYSVTIVITNIIIVKTIFNKHINKIIKNMNMVIFCILSFIMFLILNLITANNIDVYSELSIYTNNDLFTLIEINMGIFAAWIIALIILKIVTKNIKNDKEFEKEKLSEKVKKKKEDKVDNVKTPPRDFTLEEYKLLLQLLNDNKTKKDI